MTLLPPRRPSRQSHRFVVDADVLPQTLAVLRTRAEPLGIDVRRRRPRPTGCPRATLFGVLLQYPGASGAVRDSTARRRRRRTSAARSVASPPTCSRSRCSRPPGEWGADVAVGSAQRFGVPMGFGGPHAGFMSVRDGLERAAARPAGRRQRRRRRRTAPTGSRCRPASSTSAARRRPATSAPRRCCSPSSPAMYAVLPRPRRAARRSRRGSHRHAAALAGCAARAAASTCRTHAFFDTLTVARARPRARGRRRGGRPRRQPAPRRRRHRRHRAATRPRRRTTCIAVCRGVRRRAAADELAGARRRPPTRSRPSCAARRRSSPTRCSPRTAPRRRCCATCAGCRDKDLALDRAMIPLGSCTMKLNAATEMEPITWPEFADMHPFAPLRPGARLRSR